MSEQSGIATSMLKPLPMYSTIDGLWSKADMSGLATAVEVALSGASLPVTELDDGGWSL